MECADDLENRLCEVQTVAIHRTDLEMALEWLTLAYRSTHAMYSGYEYELLCVRL